MTFCMRIISIFLSMILSACVSAGGEVPVPVPDREFGGEVGMDEWISSIESSDTERPTEPDCKPSTKPQKLKVTRFSVRHAFGVNKNKQRNLETVIWLYGPVTKGTCVNSAYISIVPREDLIRPPTIDLENKRIRLHLPQSQFASILESLRSDTLVEAWAHKYGKHQVYGGIKGEYLVRP